MKVKKCANKIKALNKKKGVLGFLFLLMSVSLMAQTNVDSLLNVLDEELIRSAHYETVKKQRIALIKENALKHNISLEEEYRTNHLLFKEYEAYICDSARYYVNLNIGIAKQIGR